MARRGIDWEAIERDYRTGRFTNRELGEKHGVSHTTIARHAEKNGWTKDLSAAVRQATNAAVIAETVKQKVAEAGEQTTDAVLVAAKIGTDVILRHRRDILQLRNLGMDMLHELSLATHSPEDLAKLLHLVSRDLDQAELMVLQQSLKDLLRLPSRVGAFRKLTEAMAKLQPMERTAFGLDEEADPSKSTGRQLSDLEMASRLAYFVNLGRERAATVGDKGE